MISVLIPIYNFNAFNLVSVIHKQLEFLLQEFEIICISDASSEFIAENNAINNLSNAKLISLEKNIGRSKIRNVLIEKANYDWLLFLDADVFPKDDLFIKRYLNCITKNEVHVFCGGLIYKDEKPAATKILRWVYGKNREEISVLKRIEKPYHYVSGANFLIHKSVVEAIKFDERIINYGFEDVLFVEDLKNNNIKIAHLENPVYHLGIENSAIFLDKTKEGIKNLLFLSSNNILKGNNLTLLKTFQLLEKYRFSSIFLSVFLKFQNRIERNLLGKNPSLLLFDIFKLGYLSYLNSKKINTDFQKF